MLRVDRRLLQNVDWALLATALFIVALSVLSMWNLAPRRGGTALAWRQLSWVGIGLVALLAFSISLTPQEQKTKRVPQFENDKVKVWRSIVYPNEVSRCATNT